MERNKLNVEYNLLRMNDVNTICACLDCVSGRHRGFILAAEITQRLILFSSGIGLRVCSGDRSTHEGAERNLQVRQLQERCGLSQDDRKSDVYFHDFCVALSICLYCVSCTCRPIVGVLFSDIYKVDLVNDSLYEWNVKLMK